VLTSLLGFTLLYGVLAVVEVKLMFKSIRAGLPGAAGTPGDPTRPDSDDDGSAEADAKPLSFAY
jgi:cytochrome d ubiquinol oxidase subunit I